MNWALIWFVLLSVHNFIFVLVCFLCWNFFYCCHLVPFLQLVVFAKCHFTLMNFSVHFAGLHALILTSSLLIFCSLDCTASLALLSHYFKIFFAVWYVLYVACFCCFSFALVASSFFHFSLQLSFGFLALFILILFLFFVEIMVCWLSQIAAAKTSFHPLLPYFWG